MSRAPRTSPLRWLSLALVLGLTGACAVDAATVGAPSILPSDVPSASETPIAAPAPSSEPSESPTPTPTEAQITIAERKIEQKTDRLQVDITYPEVQGLADPAVQKRVNDAIRAGIEGWTARTDPPFQGRVPGIRGSYHVVRLDPQVASILETYNVSPPTAPHPHRTYQAFNFDLSTGEAIALRSLFTPDSPWLETLSREAPSLIIADIQQRTRLTTDEGTLSKQGYSPEEKNFWFFTLHPDGLRVTFAEYQVAAYPLGSPTVIFPWEHLAPYLADTPLVRHVAGQGG